MQKASSHEYKLVFQKQPLFIPSSRFFSATLYHQAKSGTWFSCRTKMPREQHVYIQSVFSKRDQMCRKIGCTSNRSIERTGVRCYSCLIHTYDPRRKAIEITACLGDKYV